MSFFFEFLLYTCIKFTLSIFPPWVLVLMSCRAWSTDGWKCEDSSTTPRSCTSSPAPLWTPRRRPGRRARCPPVERPALMWSPPSTAPTSGKTTHKTQWRENNNCIVLNPTLTAPFSCSITILVNRGYVPKRKIRPESRMKGQVRASHDFTWFNLLHHFQTCSPQPMPSQVTILWELLSFCAVSSAAREYYLNRFFNASWNDI